MQSNTESSFTESKTHSKKASSIEVTEGSHADIMHLTKLHQAGKSGYSNTGGPVGHGKQEAAVIEESNNMTCNVV